MSTYLYLTFDDKNKTSFSDLYKDELCNVLRQYFSVIYVNKKPPANIVSKTFSVHLMFGDKDGSLYRRHHRLNIFCFYHSWIDSFPSIEDVEKHIYILYSGFYKNIKYMSGRRNDVIVFDMDETLIDRDTVPYYKNIFKELELYRKYFKYIILWTHGTTSYLSEIDLDFKFDLYISRNADDSENKGLGAILREMNVSYGISCLDFCVLVDDTISNYENDYDVFVHVKRKPSYGSFQNALNKIVTTMNLYYSKKDFNHIIEI